MYKFEGIKEEVVKKATQLILLVSSWHGHACFWPGISASLFVAEIPVSYLE